MRHLQHSLLCLFVLTSAGLAQAQLISLQSGKRVAIADLSEVKKQPSTIAEGFDPCISRAGKSIAFTRYDKDGNRFIAVADAATGEWRLVKGIPVRIASCRSGRPTEALCISTLFWATPC